MRVSSAIVILIVTLGLTGPSAARDIRLHKRTLDEIESVCEKVGGEFSQDSRGYGCGTNCKGGPGTACTVYCLTDHRCIAQVIGGRRPTSVQNALRPRVG